MVRPDLLPVTLMLISRDRERLAARACFRAAMCTPVLELLSVNPNASAVARTDDSALTNAANPSETTKPRSVWIKATATLQWLPDSWGGKGVSLRAWRQYTLQALTGCPRSRRLCETWEGN